VVQPLISSSAIATWVDTCTISGVRPAQIGYSVFNQPNSSAFCAAGTARVSDWTMWWWVFTRPGVTTWLRASISSPRWRTSSSTSGGTAPAG
jgi:hypothetical protein